jgi:hypothetical protein
VAKLGETSVNIWEIRDRPILLDNVFIPPFDGPGASTSKCLEPEKIRGRRRMIATRTVNARVALDTIVARLNIERFCKLFPDESDETKRHMLVRLIAEEKTKLYALVASPACSDFGWE